MRFTKNTQQDTSKVLRLPRKMTMDTSKVLRLPRKLQHIFWKRHKSIAPATQNDFQHVAKHVWMSRSATPATRNEATTRLKPPKVTTSAELPIGTAIRGSLERLRTVADGCGRLRTRTQRRANTPLTPRPPEWNGNPCYAFRKKDGFEELFKRNFKRKISIAKIAKICWQINLAAWMQPLQYDLRFSAAKDNSITHAAAAPSNLDAAIPMRSATTQLQETHRTTRTGTTTRCKTHRRNNSRMKRPQPQPPHRRDTFHRRLQPLYTEKHKVSCSGFLPKT